MPLTTEPPLQTPAYVLLISLLPSFTQMSYLLPEPYFMPKPKCNTFSIHYFYMAFCNYFHLLFLLFNIVGMCVYECVHVHMH